MELSWACTKKLYLYIISEMHLPLFYIPILKLDTKQAKFHTSATLIVEVALHCVNQFKIWPYGFLPYVFWSYASLRSWITKALLILTALVYVNLMSCAHFLRCASNSWSVNIFSLSVCIYTRTHRHACFYIYIHTHKPQTHRIELLAINNHFIIWATEYSKHLFQNWLMNDEWLKGCVWSWM